MKTIKTLGVIVLFAIVIYMALGLKKRIVQQTCDTLGDYEATKSEEVMGTNDTDTWYCCPPNQDKTANSCLFYGE